VTGPLWEVRLGDCAEVMAGMDDASVDAVVCDPPYLLGFMGKQFDRQGSAFRRPSEMQVWHERWAREALRVLKPGGFLLAFGGTRVFHRLACGIEDAGFEIRDGIAWLTASGFPKSHDVSKAVDAQAGAVRRDRKVAPQSNAVYSPGVRGVDAGAPVTAAAAAAAAAAAGLGTALKPAWEAIVVARKPLSGTVAETWLQHGTGVLNINAARIGSEGGVRADGPRAAAGPGAATSFPGRPERMEKLDAGRWPANLALGHHEDCKGSGARGTDVLCAPGCPVAELNRQSGESASASMPLPRRPGDALGGTHGDNGLHTVRGHDDEGGAARFFFVAKPRRRERIAGTTRNLHPTCKPVDLMRWLIRLVTPPGGIVLDPFAGSGTTGCAAMVEGVRFLGIEKDPDYHALATGRISDWAFAHGRTPAAL
jgi:DNA modification methylase